MDYYHSILDILNWLKTEAENAEVRMQKLPNGELKKYKNGEYHKYFWKLPDRPLVYLPTSKHRWIEPLAENTYWQKYAAFLEDSRNFLQDFLKRHASWLEQKGMLYNDFNFLENCLSQPSALDRELELWENAPFDQCPYYPEQKRVEGAKGIMMRSKGEGGISYGLLNDGERFHYEQLWKFPECDIYPDFTIRHPKTGEFIIWEHFGLMDKPSYVQDTICKLKVYEANGFCPGSNLIVTFEDRNHPLSQRRIMNEIEYFFH